MLCLQFFKVTIENHKPFITLSGDKNLRLEKQSQLSMICQRLKNWGYRRSILSTMGFHLKMFVGN
jgi:hypothetical protein